MNSDIEYTDLDELALDPENPRLGRYVHQKELTQPEILKEMSKQTLDEIAISFLESGFWPHEAVLCVRDTIEGEEKLVVVEGNRRLGALIMLKDAFEGNAFSRRWDNIIADRPHPKELFTRIPFIELKKREEVDAFLGFRHVTGIKEWAPAEKAQFITYLINKRGMSYVDVMRKIGSKTEAVRRNYIAYSMLLQMEDTEDIAVDRVEDKFSVLFLSLREAGVRSFLNVNIEAEPDEAKTPIDADHIGKLVEYARWLFGDDTDEPFVTDSRQVGRFGIVLASADALNYVRSVRRPSLEKAYKLAGGEEAEIIDLIEQAAFNIEEALSSIHLYRDVERIQKGVDRLLKDSDQLAKTFKDS